MSDFNYSRTTISMTPEEKAFLDGKGLSPSKIVQEKIREMQEGFDLETEKKEFMRKLDSWKKLCGGMRDFIKFKGLEQEWLDSQGVGK